MQHKPKGLWEVQKNHSEWMKGFSAGGCGNTPNEGTAASSINYGLYSTNRVLLVHFSAS